MALTHRNGGDGGLSPTLVAKARAWRPLRPKGGGRALPRLSPGSGSGAPRALELGDGRGEGIEREGYVLVRVGKRDIVLALAFEDAALAQEGVAAPHEGFLAQSGAVVLHLA